MNRGPRPRACGAVIRNGKVLMVRHRHDGREYWTLPGGGVEPGETFEQAAVREMAEETGLTTRVVRQLWEGMYEDGPSTERCFLLEEAAVGQVARLGIDPEESAKPPAHRMLKEAKWWPLEGMKDDVQVSKVVKALGEGS